MTNPKGETEQPYRYDWIWYGESDGQMHVSFGRWQSHPCQYRYKYAEIQPTEHDHAARPQTGRER